MLGTTAALIASAIAAAGSTASTMYAANKASKAAKLPASTQKLQDQSLQLQNQRMQMFQPLLQRMSAGANQRLPASYGAPTIGQMRTPGAGQALSQLARGLPGPEQRRRRYRDMA
jgi:hypothetical protein